MANVSEVRVPDIGDFDEVEVIEVIVNKGDSIKPEDPLVTLESDKATMDVPSPVAGVVQEVKVNAGDRVSQGSAIVIVAVVESAVSSGSGPQTTDSSTKPVDLPDTPGHAANDMPTPSQADTSATVVSAPGAHPPPSSLPPPVERAGVANPHASPAVRRFARELGVNLAQVRGSGAKGRIVKPDVQSFIKQQMSAPAPAGGAGLALPALPQIDFSEFGEIDVQPLGRIKRLTASNVHRSWLNIPHVTQNDEADITELETFRQNLKAEAEEKGIRLTMLAYIMRAVVGALKEYPQFNSSLETGGDNLILKKYINIGIAVATPAGLMVPVIREVDKKGVFELAAELADVSRKAREKKLPLDGMQGGSFTISSLGGIGGTSFTPIINAPEVAILGVSRSHMKPVYRSGEFVPRLTLPLSLSYDHRVIDGAEAARFCSYLCGLLSDVRRLIL